MNPVVIVHFLAGVVSMASALPLIRGRVKMNEWYGVRIPAAFASEAAWFEINRYGGRLFFIWGSTVAATAIVGAFVSRTSWKLYNGIALAIIVVGVIIVVSQIYRYAAKRDKR